MADHTRVFSVGTSKLEAHRSEKLSCFWSETESVGLVISFSLAKFRSRRVLLTALDSQLSDLAIARSNQSAQASSPREVLKMTVIIDVFDGENSMLEKFRFELCRKLWPRCEYHCARLPCLVGEYITVDVEEKAQRWESPTFYWRCNDGRSHLYLPSRPHLSSRLLAGFWKRVATHVVKELAAFCHHVCDILPEPFFRQCRSRHFNFSHKAACYLLEVT